MLPGLLIQIWVLWQLMQFLLIQMLGPALLMR